MTISKKELINYLNSQKFLKNWKCKALQDSYIRNKISHSDYYYNNESNNIVFGNKAYNIDEFQKILERTFSFYCYLTYKLYEGANFINTKNALEQLKEKIGKPNENSE